MKTKINFRHFGFSLALLSLFAISSFNKLESTVYVKPTPIGLKIAPSCGSVTDIDGNKYETVKIGTQCWMQTNLSVSKYRNGETIPEITNPVEWQHTKKGAFCYYENKTENGTTYGKLYNWYAVNDPRGLAPEGYHIATLAEFETLVKVLGGEKPAGGKMKSTSGWDNPTSNSTTSNSSGFTALAGGYRTINGWPWNVGKNGYWWMSTEENPNLANSFYLWFDNSYVKFNKENKLNGFSVRCIKN